MGLMKSLAIELGERRERLQECLIEEDDPCLRCGFADFEKYECMDDGSPLGGGWGCKHFRANNGGATEHAIPVAPVIFRRGVKKNG